MDKATDRTLLRYIDKSVLERFQNSFANMTGMTAVIANAEGLPITGGANNRAFCTEYVHCSKYGTALCSSCVRYGADEAFRKGRSSVRYCHAGLLEFFAPIVADEKIIGIFVAGKVYTYPPIREDIDEIADEIGASNEDLWEAAGEIPVVSAVSIEKALVFLNTMSQIISEMIQSRILIQKSRIEVDRVAQMKSDFLSNMSHEIRTPMNAVLGMADLALRENLTPAAKDFMLQIQSSGKALLNIVNDILDYSKIESGKLSINEEEYEPMSLVHDVSTIIMSRLVDKEIELLVDIVPDIPRLLIGDSQRIRQIFINLANNAVKFTDKGHVLLKVDYEQLDDETIMLKVYVQDTGIGIREEDLKKLFGSFSQVDKKRNKNIEGTGLGLSIVRQLVKLMDGNVNVESEYGKGSTFSFEIPQKIANKEPSIELSDPKAYVVAGFFVHDDVAEDFQHDAGRIGIDTYIFEDSDNPGATVDAWIEDHTNQECYVIIEQAMFSREIMGRVDVTDHKYDHVHAVVLADTFADVRQWDDMPFLKIMKKPISVLSIAALLNQSEVKIRGNKIKREEMPFEAPEAKILIVDDNNVNLTVAEGLLEPLNMQVDKALSGKIALDMIKDTHYDIIFMDHMMPELDGVETTKLIRSFYRDYDNVPIIALTANAVSGARDMFVKSGMDDFLAKPIEVKLFTEMVRNWLPEEKIVLLTLEERERRLEEIKLKKAEKQAEKQAEKKLQIGDLDVAYSMNLLGNEKLFWVVLKEYYKSIEKKAVIIENAYAKEDWSTYTIEVHALKSASKQVGAFGLSELAAKLEKAGHDGDIDTIRFYTGELLSKYRNYIPVMRPHFEEDEAANEQKPAIEKAVLKEQLEKILNAVEDLSMDEAEAAIRVLDEYSYEEKDKELFEALKEAYSMVDFDACEEIINKWNV